ncbi:MAG: N-acetylmuramoyl-L-alanine amidase [Verrucomicrobiales bacterium]|nr:N-acetylmuramoyl-L-alanine amidase [Verrucomicrobiales bacterium]
MVFLASFLAACSKNKPTTPPAPHNLGELAPTPDWQSLQVFQRTITREDFIDLLQNVYLESGAAGWSSTIKVTDRYADIVTNTHPAATNPTFRLHFATSAQTPPPRYWRSPRQLPPASDLDRHPLSDLRIAIDPGHIGGGWAKMEERWYTLGAMPVMEGSLTLQVARLLAPKLEALGARVTLVRESEDPVTQARPINFVQPAREFLSRIGIDPDAPPASYSYSVEKQSQRLFYRTREIRDRATLVNGVIRPDITICLHFNAEAWGDPQMPTLTEKNHFHMLINGCYSRGELRLDDQRFDLLTHLLQRNHREERALAESLALSFSKHTGLPPFVYQTPNARSVGQNRFLYARNLLANRAYKSPVVFFEPYVMNSREVYARIQAGLYDGDREVAGTRRPSIFHEYADSVADGLADYYRNNRNIRKTL